MNNKIPLIVSLLLTAVACQPGSDDPKATDAAAPDSGAVQLSDADIDNLVEQTYRFVAMYNVNNKFAMSPKQGGWNTCQADTELKDHTLRDIARPNNDTLYTGCMLDLRKDPIILNIPAFDSDYASLMVTGYDHYVNVPLASRNGDFDAPTTMLFYTERTEGYDGEAVDSVEHYFEATGDFISAVFRVMPHASDPDRFQRIVGQKQSIRPTTLSVYRGGAAKPVDEAGFPPVGATDADVFGDNFLEVMQFVFNHTTFEPDNPMDRAALDALEPLGIVPGQEFDATKVATVDGARLRAAAGRIQRTWLAKLNEPGSMDAMPPLQFQPKGQTDHETTLAVSIIGPIGLPQEEALYTQVGTADGTPMNAMHDYVIRMSAAELPPARAFWSLTLYDLDEGFFIPNDRKKYSVGENAGMVLGEDGGIAIYIAADKPDGVPEENWLPIERKDLDINPMFRLYAPDILAYEAWEPPRAEKLP